MADILRCRDQWGREIVLTYDRWRAHIIDHHPEMEGNIEAVREAIVNPFLVVYDKHRRGVENFYLPFVLPPPNHLTYLKVCVLFRSDPLSGDALGQVLTAFSTDDTQQGENQKWPDP